VISAEVKQRHARLHARDGEVDLDRDRELVVRAQSGDKTAFDALYARYFTRLERYCVRRLGDSYEAQDVAQEAFLRAWRALPDFGGDRRFYPWLSVIASNLCTDSLRRKRRFGPVPMAEPGDHEIASSSSTEDSVVASVEMHLAAKAYSQLSDRHKRVLDLRERSGLSYQAIAEQEGVRVTAVETLIWRARQAFKREYTALSGPEERLAGIVAVGALQAGVLRRVLRAASSVPGRVGSMAPQGVFAAVGGAVATAAIVVASASPGTHVPRSADAAPRVPGSVASGIVAPSKYLSPAPAGLTGRRSDTARASSRRSATDRPGAVHGTRPATRSKVTARPVVGGTPIAVPVVAGGPGVGATGGTGVRKVKTVATQSPRLSGTGQEVRKILKTAVAGVSTNAANIEKTIVNTAKSLGEPLGPVPVAGQAATQAAQVAAQGAVQSVAQAVSALSGL
jgi:RNA polymerase sigma-70 factor, ECF subfamily